MTIEKVFVPDIGDFDEVEIIEVLVSAGERVEVEQSLVTLESDKATMELPSPFAGVVKHIHVAVGDKIGEGAALVDLETQAAEEKEGASADSESDALVERRTETAPVAAALASEPARPLAELERPVKGEGDPIATLRAQPARIAFASPSVRRLAFELGVDLLRVTGTGRKGRILKEDVQDFVKAALVDPSPPPASGGFSVPEMPQIDFSKFGEIEIQALNKIRRVSARNLHRSWITVPHVTQFDEADITDLEEFRRSSGMAASERKPKITILVFLMKALTTALRDFPQFNASLAPDGESIILKKYFHIGVAVDTEHGLVVPVIRDVDRKGLVELSEELAVVSQKARDRKLKPADLSGGSISISSLGGIGGTAFTPIVNAPEVAILGVSRSQIKSVYQHDAFVPRLMLPLSLSYDHRAIDGADAVRFTTRLKSLVMDIRNFIL